MSRWCRSVPHRNNIHLEFKGHTGERMIGINHHIPVIFIHLGDHYVLDPTLVITMREKTHSRLNLIDATKRFSRHTLL